MLDGAQRVKNAIALNLYRGLIFLVALATALHEFPDHAAVVIASYLFIAQCTAAVLVSIEHASKNQLLAAWRESLALRFALDDYFRRRSSNDQIFTTLGDDLSDVWQLAVGRAKADIERGGFDALITHDINGVPKRPSATLAFLGYAVGDLLTVGVAAMLSALFA